jgi:hypothetical protein
MDQEEDGEEEEDEEEEEPEPLPVPKKGAKNAPFKPEVVTVVKARVVSVPSACLTVPR